MKKSFILLLAMAVVLFSTNVMAGTAKGKPFIELEGKIVEVSNAVFDVEQALEELTGQVADLDERLTVTEGSITNLQNENVAIEGQIDALIAAEAVNSQAIRDALTRIGTLEGQIVDLQVDVLGNQSQIDASNAEIDELKIFVAENTAGVLALKDDIANNLDLIEALQQELVRIEEALALKQDNIDYRCPEGQALSEVFENGYSCFDVEADGGGVSNVRLRYRTLFYTFNHSKDYYGTNLYMSCNQIDEPSIPGSWYVVSGGFQYEGDTRINFGSNRPYGSQMWYLSTLQQSGQDLPVYGWIRCSNFTVE